MALNIESKKVIVEEMSAIAAESLAAATAEYRGMTVAEMTNLRKEARERGVFLKVVKNTLARRAVQGTEFEAMGESFTGPLIYAFAKEEPSAAARLIRDFAKESDKLVVNSLAVGGQVHGPEQLEAIAKLPNREEALALLMSVMTAPITKLVRTTNDIPGRVVRVIAAVRDQKQG
jgi:large subunit ribosomal protein L10